MSTKKGNYCDERKYIPKKIKGAAVACCHSVEKCRLHVTNRGHKSAILRVVLCWCGNRSSVFSKGNVTVIENRVVIVLYVVTGGSSGKLLKAA